MDARPAARYPIGMTSPDFASDVWSRRLARLIFVAAFLAFGFFHQGGGWNPNARFAMVRAIVEQGKFSIDSYLIYTHAQPDPSTELRRVPVRDGEFTIGGQTKILVWIDPHSRPVPVRGDLDGHDSRQINFSDLRATAVTGDVAYFQGHFHPNKAPGTSFIAIPAYWFIYHFERIIGANPDDWWTLTLNAWLTGAFSVGLLSALGVLLCYRLALAFSGGRRVASVMTALAFAFGTMFFVHATSLYEHNVVAVGLIASFYLLYRVKTDLGRGSAVGSFTDIRAEWYLFLSGLCAGYAAITNYIVAVVVIILGVYLLFGVRKKIGWLWFGLGLLGPFLLICAYNVACFGTPFTTNYRYQNPFFRSGNNAFLDVLVWPRWDILLTILFSPFRGLFFTSPILLLGPVGLVWLFQHKCYRDEAWLLSAIFGIFILFNTSFNGWDGGWGVVPRYLGPAVPFLALGVVSGFIRFFKISCLLAALSIGMMLLTTAVDPQAPCDVNATSVLGKQAWQLNPLTAYELPIFLTRHPGPLIRIQEEQVLHYYDSELARKGTGPELRQNEVQKLRQYIDEQIATSSAAPLVLNPTGQNDGAEYSIDYSPLSAIATPVSVNPGGIYGGWVDGAFGGPGSPQARWNSFNVGEFLFPESQWSLFPLLLVDGVLVWLALRIAGEIDRSANSHSNNFLNANPGSDSCQQIGRD